MNPITVLFILCWNCHGRGKEPDYLKERTCIICGGTGRLRAKEKQAEPREG